MERHRGPETHMNVSFIEMQFTAESSFSWISCFGERVMMMITLVLCVFGILFKFL